MTLDKKEQRKIRMLIALELDKTFPDEKKLREWGALIGQKTEQEIQEEKKNRRENHKNPIVVNAEEYVNMRNNNKSRQKIADHYGISKEELERQLYRLRYQGLLVTNQTSKGKTFSIEMSVEEYQKLKRSGLSDSEICRRNNWYPSLLTSWKHRNEVDLDIRGRKERITWVTKEKFFELRSKGWTLNEIAKELNCCRNYLYKERKKWGDVK